LNRKERRAAARAGRTGGNAARAVSPRAAEAFRLGLAHHQAGRLGEAEARYRETLAAAPDHADALHLLGVIASQVGKHDVAIQLIGLAIAEDGRNALYHTNHGLALAGLRRFEEAIASYDRALAVQPTFVEALCNRANALAELGRDAEALASYDRALALQSDHANALFNRGGVLLRLGRPDDALASYDGAVAARRDFVEAWFNRGVLLQERGRREEALASYEQTLALRSDHADAHCNYGVVLQELGRHDEAIASYDRALAARPDYAEALSNRGNTLKALGRFGEALASYDQALALRPDYVEALSNRGVVLQALHRFDEALASHDSALALHPYSALVLNNRAGVLQELGRFDEALAGYERALALEPDYAEAGLNRALLLLLTGAFTEGWPAYEWRRRTAAWEPRRFPAPEWAGEDVAGKRLLLYAEQGFGDTIQFVRYARLVVARGAHVTLEVQPALAGLLAASGCADAVVAAGTPLPPFDLHCPLLSLPKLFATTIANIPAQIPYINPPPERIAAWRARLLPDAPRVGLAWSGHRANSKDHHRSIAFAQLMRLFAVPGVRFVSLHKDVRASDADALASCCNIVDVRAELTDFADTAALIANLDLVVTVDTAVAHLAGAMGRPVWILLPRVPDFRWLIDRADSPWYPSARLYRQTRAGEWDEVIARVAGELPAYTDG
jgi:tetratricopeptide (TPR) repeat protein